MDVGVEGDDAGDIFPNSPAAGVEDMGSVEMHLNALAKFGVGVAADVWPLFQQQAAFSRPLKFRRAHGPEQPCPDDKKVVFHFP